MSTTRTPILEALEGLQATGLDRLVPYMLNSELVSEQQLPGFFWDSHSHASMKHQKFAR